MLTIRRGIMALCGLAAGIFLLEFRPAFSADDGVPYWAYPMRPPSASAPTPPQPTPTEELKHVPNSNLAVTLAKTEDSFDVPDWHPEDHPAAPDLILHGRRSNVEACAHCHLPNGLGTNIIQAPGLAGLSVPYIIQQVADFKSGARKNAVPKFGGGRTMVYVIKPTTDEDIKVAAEYFASLKAKPWFRVVEAARVPQSKVEGMMVVPVNGAALEPIGTRIVELPEDLERTELRDSQSGYVAYVPPGSIKKGEALVTTGGKGTTVACTICHGTALQGLGPVPPLAGRSPSYIVRQLYDIQQGTRTGVWSALMVPVVAKLSTTDMLEIAAYAASRAP